MRISLLVSACLIVAILPREIANVNAQSNRADLSTDDNWAVIVSSSRFWLNYRHTTNALGVYAAIKRLGIPDSRIILMLADCSACDPRNPTAGEILANPRGINLHSSSVQVDYRDRDVTVESVMQVLTGHHPPGTPPSRRLDSSSNSSVLLYFTGHGGDGFLKFHDQNELLSSDLAAAISQMHQEKRYRELLIMLDTCQAATMYSDVTAPHWVGIASSHLGQSSYALQNDPIVGAHLVDEFSYHLSSFLNRLPAQNAKATLKNALEYITRQKMSSSVHIEDKYLGRGLDTVDILQFFGSRSSGDSNSVEWSRDDDSSSSGSSNVIDSSSMEYDDKSSDDDIASSAFDQSSVLLKDVLLLNAFTA